MTPADFHPEDADAFDRGVLTGKDAAFKGLPFPQPCVDLNVAGPSAFHLSPVGDEAALAVWELAKGAFAGAVASGVLLVVELSIGRETFSDDPDAALARQATALQDLLRRMRILTGELSLGGAADLSVAGCELLFPPVVPRAERRGRFCARFGQVEVACSLLGHRRAPRRQDRG